MVFEVEGGPAAGRTIESDRWLRTRDIDGQRYELHCMAGWHYCHQPEKPADAVTARAAT
jgi:hypothetical protein